MKQVDRLLIEAKKLAGYSGPELTLALVERFGDSWTAAAHLWDRLPGHSPAIKKSAHTTQDAAVEYIHRMAKQYPNSRDVVIIVDDVW